MSEIVCPIRGGLESKITVNQAVILAQETNHPLCFLHVVNPNRFSAAGTDDKDRLIETLQRMGCSVIGAANAWAQSHGVKSRGLVRLGTVEETITSLCDERKATYLVLGRSQPQSTEGESVFSPEQFAHLVERIGTQTGTVVVFR